MIEASIAIEVHWDEVGVRVSLERLAGLVTAHEFRARFTAETKLRNQRLVQQLGLWERARSRRKR